MSEISAYADQVVRIAEELVAGDGCYECEAVVELAYFSSGTIRVTVQSEFDADVFEVDVDGEVRRP